MGAEEGAGQSGTASGPGAAAAARRAERWASSTGPARSSGSGPCWTTRRRLKS